MEILKLIADNPALSEALRTILDKQFDSSSIKLATILEVDDKRLGEIVRANAVGLDAIEAAFKEIERYKTQPPRPEVRNEAR